MSSHSMDHILRRVLMIVLVITLVPYPVFSGGAGPQERNSPHKSSVDQPPKNDEHKGFVKCSEPRPQMCTMDYRPVCAELSGGSHKTISNGCTACSDANVSGYRDGVCD